MDNSEEEEKAALYFAKQGFGFLTPQHVGVFIEKHSHPVLLLATGQFSLVKDRPFFNSDLLVLKADATRRAVLHEFLHYLLALDRREKGLLKTHSVGGTEISPTNYLMILAAQYEAKLSTEEKNNSSLEKRAELWLDFAYTTSLYFLNSAAEEVAIEQWTLSNAERLSLTRSDILSSLRYQQVNLNLVNIQARQSLYDETYESVLTKSPDSKTKERFRKLCTFRASILGSYKLLQTEFLQELEKRGLND